MFYEKMHLKDIARDLRTNHFPELRHWFIFLRITDTETLAQVKYFLNLSIPFAYLKVDKRLICNGDNVVTGAIAHEFAHILTKHYPTPEERERKSDELVVARGLGTYLLDCVKFVEQVAQRPREPAYSSKELEMLLVGETITG